MHSYIYHTILGTKENPYVATVTKCLFISILSFCIVIFLIDIVKRNTNKNNM